MDPVSIVVTALALGAAAGLKKTVSQAVQDGYAGLKTWITGRYAKVNVEQLEANPKSKARQDVVSEDLAEAKAGDDLDLLRKAKELLDLIRKDAPEAAGAIGVDLEDIKAKSLSLERIVSSGTAVKVKGADIREDFKITDVTAGAKGKGRRKNP